MGIWNVIGRRIALSMITLLLVSLAMFSLMHAVPGDPIDAVLGERQADRPEVREAFERLYGLDKPLPVQYGYYIRNLLQGDFGRSISTNQPVSEELRTVIPATVELAFTAMTLALLLGVPLGILAAIRRNRWPDHLARLLAVAGASIPIFWMALLAAYLFAVKLRWLPRSGQLDVGMEPPPRVTGLISVDALVAGDADVFWSFVRHIILPASVLALFALGLITRMLRSSLVEVMSEEYIRTARAKGLAERRVLVGHALRNALLPTITVLGLTFSGLLTGTTLVETIFSWPGMGQYAVRMASSFDYPGLIGVTLVVAVIYIVVSLLVDIVYSLLDPRVRVGG